MNRTFGGVLGGLLGLVALSAVAGVLVTATVTPAIAITGAATKQAIDLFDDLPSYLRVDDPMEAVNINVPQADGTYRQLATFFDQNREPLTFDQLSPIVIDAILSSEDKLFYEHAGVNLGATAKAAYDNLRGTSSRGASTISQQFVKNVQIQQCEQELDPAMEGYGEALQQCWLDATESSGTEGIQRKLQEMRYALQIEKDYSKDEILLGYLNIANFGGQVYGIEAAAKRYFSVSAKDLTIAQAATLAGIVQEPNAFRIDRDTERNNAENGFARTQTRRNYVIDRMLEDGKITKDQHDAAIATPIEPKLSTTTPGCGLSGATGYYCTYVLKELESHPALGETREERRNAMRRGGFEVYATMDPEVQQAGQNVMADRVPVSVEGMHFGAAAVTLENNTGRVLAIAQNTTFKETADARWEIGETPLVYAAGSDRGASGGFPVGSTYKLFTLIDWLEKGRSINEVLNGTRQTFRSYLCNGEPQVNNTPISNFGGGGGSVGTVARFTQQSLNTGYLAMATQLDVCEINAVAARMGVRYGTGEPATTFKAAGQVIEDYGVLYDVLGSKNIAAIDIAGAYAAVANGGMYCKPYAIDRIVGRDGTDIFVAEPDCTQVLTPEVAATAAHALRGVMQGGTGGASNTGDGVPLIGKTGTHQRFQTMMVASSTQTTTATWVGNVRGEDSLYTRSYRGTQLSNLRHVITREIQRAANARYGGGAFPAPDANLTRTVYTDLPSVLGLSIAEATEQLEDLGFVVEVGGEVDSDQPAGTVGAQDPGAGNVAGGTMVTLYPSNGQAVMIPEVQGMTPAAAVSHLQSRGFSNASLGNCSVDGSMPPGSAEATGTRPGAGQVLHKNTNVRVDYRSDSC